MDASANVAPVSKAFTLVELLVVIVIIGILAGLITGAVVRARVLARDAVIRADVTELQNSLQNYKTQVGEFPPDFANVTSTDTALRNAAQDAVIRHLRKAFPRYSLPSPDPANANDLAWQTFCSHVTANYPALDPRTFDAASALVFWLGGLPETNAITGQWIPAGFHADPTQPFRTGLPRTKPLSEFNPERVALLEPHPDDPTDPSLSRPLRYYPEGVKTPYAYYRARRLAGVWGYAAVDSSNSVVQLRYEHATDNYCVPYGDVQNPPGWRSHDTYQVISAGLDGQFGTGAVNVPRVTKSGSGFTDGDYDNLTSFAKGTLGDEIE